MEVNKKKYVDKEINPEGLSLDNNDLFFKCSMIFFIQVLILTFVVSSAFSGDDGLEFVKPTFKNMVLRVCTAYLFHLGNYNEIYDSYKKYKFIRYNAYKFGKEE